MTSITNNLNQHVLTNNGTYNVEKCTYLLSNGIKAEYTDRNTNIIIWSCIGLNVNDLDDKFCNDLDLAFCHYIVANY